MHCCTRIQPPSSILAFLFTTLAIALFCSSLSCFLLLIILFTLSFPFPMFFPTYICQAKVMSQLIYHPAISESTSGNHQEPTSTRPTSPTFFTPVETTTELSGHKTSCDSCWEAECTHGWKCQFSADLGLPWSCVFQSETFPTTTKSKKWAKDLKYPQTFASSSIKE